MASPSYTHQHHNGNGSPRYVTPRESHTPHMGSSSPYVTPPEDQSGLRRRHFVSSDPVAAAQSPAVGSTTPSPKKFVKNLDFMYTKVERDYKVQTEKKGRISVVVVAVIAGVLCLAEVLSHVSQNRDTTEHIRVDTSLGQKMRIQLNITFPALACVDLHVDAMDVAGDSQLDLTDSLKKIPLRLDGSKRTQDEIQVELNTHQEMMEEKQRILRQELPKDYCGPCYGATAEVEDGGEFCCQTCDDVLEAYNRMKWNSGILVYSAEQCIREGRDRREPKRMTQGQGCNLSGWMEVNRVAGNFHIAMGEGVERDGRHIHTYVPEDTPNFNASHVIHSLEFGPDSNEESPLNGVRKIVTTQTGTTGLFQYFIKVVPTTYTSPPPTKQAKNQGSSDSSLETNRYFVTERFRPLMEEYLDEHPREGENDELVSVHAGHDHQSHEQHHKVENAVLPGVFFIYEIYPFAVEISPNSVPITHLLIRLMATVGGIFALVSWVDQVMHVRQKQQNRRKF